MIDGFVTAAAFAAERHAQQRRKGADAEPYINHCLRVAQAVGVVSNATIWAIAAVLHDTVEDTATSPSEIVNLFGPTVAMIVVEVTDDKALPKVERKLRQIINAPTLSAAAACIRVADAIDNCRDMRTRPPVAWSADRVDEYLEHKRRVVRSLPGYTPVIALRTVFWSEFGT